MGIKTARARVNAAASTKSGTIITLSIIWGRKSKEKERMFFAKEIIEGGKKKEKRTEKIKNKKRRKEKQIKAKK